MQLSYSCRLPVHLPSSLAPTSLPPRVRALASTKWGEVSHAASYSLRQNKYERDIAIIRTRQPDIALAVAQAVPCPAMHTSRTASPIDPHSESSYPSCIHLPAAMLERDCGCQRSDVAGGE